MIRRIRCILRPLLDEKARRPMPEPGATPRLDTNSMYKAGGMNSARPICE
jgi:hypothetical protein